MACPECDAATQGDSLCQTCRLELRYADDPMTDHSGAMDDAGARCQVALRDGGDRTTVDDLLAKAQELADSERARYHIREARQLEQTTMEVYAGP